MNVFGDLLAESGINSLVSNILGNLINLSTILTIFIILLIVYFILHKKWGKLIPLFFSIIHLISIFIISVLEYHNVWLSLSNPIWLLSYWFIGYPTSLLFISLFFLFFTIGMIINPYEVFGFTSIGEYNSWCFFVTLVFFAIFGTILYYIIGLILVKKGMKGKLRLKIFEKDKSLDIVATPLFFLLINLFNKLLKKNKSKEQKKD